MNLVEPGTLYGDRLNQVDLRFSKLFNVGTGAARSECGPLQRLQLGRDPRRSRIPTAPTWQNALTVIQPRFVKFSARWDF